MTLYCVDHHWKILVLTCPTHWKVLDSKTIAFNRALKFYPNYTNTLRVLTLDNDKDISPTIYISNILFKNVISLEFKKLSQDRIMTYLPLFPNLQELLLTSCYTNTISATQASTANSSPWQPWLPRLFSFGCSGTTHLIKNLQFMQNIHFLWHLAVILLYKNTPRSHIDTLWTCLLALCATNEDPLQTLHLDGLIPPAKHNMEEAETFLVNAKALTELKLGDMDIHQIIGLLGDPKCAPSLKILALEYINSTHYQVTELALILKIRGWWSEFLGSPSANLCLILSGVVLRDVEVEVNEELGHLKSIKGITVKQCRIDSNM